MRWDRSRGVLIVLLAGLASVVCIRLPFTNLPPETPAPSVISGHGSLWEPCTLAVRTTDPDGDSVAFQTAVSSGGYYYEHLDWTVYVASGKCCTLLILAGYEGTYQVRLRARDTQNDSTDFGAPVTLVFESGADRHSQCQPGHAASGRRSLNSNGRDQRWRACPSGVYFCSLKAEDNDAAEKMLIAK